MSIPSPKHKQSNVPRTSKIEIYKDHKSSGQFSKSSQNSFKSKDNSVKASDFGPYLKESTVPFHGSFQKAKVGTKERLSPVRTAMNAN